MPQNSLPSFQNVEKHCHVIHHKIWWWLRRRYSIDIWMHDVSQTAWCRCVGWRRKRCTVQLRGGNYAAQRSAMRGWPTATTAHSRRRRGALPNYCAAVLYFLLSLCKHHISCAQLCHWVHPSINSVHFLRSFLVSDCWSNSTRSLRELLWFLGREVHQLDDC